MVTYVMIHSITLRNGQYVAQENTAGRQDRVNLRDRTYRSPLTVNSGLCRHLGVRRCHSWQWHSTRYWSHVISLKHNVGLCAGMKLDYRKWYILVLAAVYAVAL